MKAKYTMLSGSLPMPVKGQWTLDIEFVPTPSDNFYFKKLQLGGVAHELGSIPMRMGDNTDAWSVNDDLKLRSREGLYVCDLSVFPVSPEANTTLTLAAPALRLSEHVIHVSRSNQPTKIPPMYPNMPSKLTLQPLIIPNGK
jgi:choline dehydrogenase-like flavoprotein